MINQTDSPLSEATLAAVKKWSEKHSTPDKPVLVCGNSMLTPWEVLRAIEDSSSDIGNALRQTLQNDAVVHALMEQHS